MHLKKKFFCLPILLCTYLSVHQGTSFAQTLSLQVGSFTDKENARDLVTILSEDEIDCTVLRVEDKYTVRCGEFSERENAYDLQAHLLQLGYADVFIIAPRTDPIQSTSAAGEVMEESDMPPPAPPVHEPDTEYYETPASLPGEAEAEDEDAGDKADDDYMSGGGIDGDVFERNGGYFHPFLSLRGYYTDNIFNTKDDKKADFAAVISPGLWISVPRFRDNLTEAVSLPYFNPKFPRRYQTFLLYRGDIEQFSTYSSENVSNHKVEGFLQYNFRGGLSINQLDRFEQSHDPRGMGTFDQLDKYNSNIFNIILNYAIGEKLMFRVDYVNFFVDYTASRNDFRDRADNSFAGYLFFKIMPKTALFAEYDYVGIDYDKDSVSNSTEHHSFVGIQWDITAKSKGSVKAGQGFKYFDNPAVDDHGGGIIEAMIDHNFTPKTSLRFIASRKTRETNIPATYFIISGDLRTEYRQKLTEKTSVLLDLSYSNYEYKGDLTFGGETKRREDNLYTADIAFQFALNKWLKTDIGYTYAVRGSNFSAFNYTTNTTFVKFTGSL